MPQSSRADISNPDSARVVSVLHVNRRKKKGEWPETRGRAGSLLQHDGERDAAELKQRLGQQGSFVPRPGP